MVFDLGLAMRKKEGFESSRLMQFEFRRRARATRMLVTELGLDEAIAATLVASVPEQAVPAAVAERANMPVEAVAIEYFRCLRVAHQQLVDELGDPTPQRLG